MHFVFTSFQACHNDIAMIQMNPQSEMAEDTFDRLRTRWWAAAGLCILMLAGGILLFRSGRSRPEAVQWISQAMIIMIYVLGLLRYGLRWNYHPIEKVLRSNLGYGTWLTITRGGLIALLGGYLFQPWPASIFFPGRLSWAPGLLYITASTLDFLDGRIARACGRESRLGAFLDINFDALGLLIAPLAAIWYGQLPAAYLSVGVAYYAYVAGIRLRKNLSKPVVVPGPWRGARIIAGIQMGFVGIALLPIADPSITRPAAYAAMAPLLAGFVRDWMFVCGYLKRN